MDILMLLFFMIILIIVILAFTFIKGVLKAIMIVSGFLLVISLILLVVIYLDFKDIQENFPIKEKLVILKNNDKVLAGFSFINFDENKIPKALTKNELTLAQRGVESNDYSELKKSYYKIIVTDISSYDNNLENGLSIPSFEGVSFSKEEIIGSISSDDPTMLVIKKIKEDVAAELSDEDLKKLAFSQLNITSDEEFKSIIFMMVLFDAYNDEGPIFIIEKIKSKEIRIVPATIIFRIITFIPDFVFEKVLQNISPPQAKGEMNP